MPRTRVFPWSNLLSGTLDGRPLATRPFYFDDFAKIISLALAKYQFDVVQIEHSFMACYRDAVPDSSRAKTVLSFHNVGSQQYRRIAGLEGTPLRKLAFGAKARLMRGWEARIASRFDCCLVVSRQESSLLRAGNASLEPVVIANGVACDELLPLAEATGGEVLFFVGVLGYPPNSDGLAWFAREVWPLIIAERPRVRLEVAGHAPPPEVMKLNDIANVTVRGFVEEIISYYQQASVVIVPLRAGGGTRLKVLEAMALGRAVVSTTIGCEGLEVVPGEHLLIADDPAEFAAAVLGLLGDDTLRQRIVKSARRLVEDQYDWHAIGSKLAGVYHELASTRVGMGTGRC
ncbi:MAG TPA: glycosyltransferase family 4 protein [Acidisarcina sp.]